jgi:hypothetical protein
MMLSGLKKRFDTDAYVMRVQTLVAAAVKACPALKSRLSPRALSGPKQQDLRACFASQGGAAGSHGSAAGSQGSAGQSNKRQASAAGTTPKKKNKISDFFT